MFDLPPDLPRLRTLRTWHAMVVREIDRAITAAEQREAEEQRAVANRDRARPPAADWTVEFIRGTRQPLTVHVGDCYMPGHTEPCDRDAARRLITGGTEPCAFCRPDTALGL